VKTHINPSSATGWPFSEAILVDETLYLSGRIGFVPGTTQVPDDAATEARYLLEGLRDVLAKAGMTMDDLVHVQIYTPDVSLFQTFNDVYRTFFQHELPARAFLGSGPLLFGARFEIVSIARKS
jgi:2-iminobutanoate/2-iminopropanoate deaminase